MSSLITLPCPKRWVTCKEAAELCKQVGSRIVWRPDGKLNAKAPELDLAEVVEG